MAGSQGHSLHMSCLWNMQLWLRLSGCGWLELIETRIQGRSILGGDKAAHTGFWNHGRQPSPIPVSEGDRVRAERAGFSESREGCRLALE